MVRTKHTNRKTSAGLPAAHRPHACQECRREIEGMSNFRRHMAIVNKKNVDGTDADAAMVSCFSQYAHVRELSRPLLFNRRRTLSPTTRECRSCFFIHLDTSPTPPSEVHRRCTGITNDVTNRYIASHYTVRCRRRFDTIVIFVSRRLCRQLVHRHHR